jgi:hypothetical protein
MKRFREILKEKKMPKAKDEDDDVEKDDEDQDTNMIPKESDE